MFCIILISSYSTLIMNIFVAKLSPSISDEDLKGLFAGFGEVTSAKVIQDKESGNSKGFGFVEMANDNEALNAISGLNEMLVAGRNMVVKKARPREEGSARENVRRGGDFQKRSDYGQRDNNERRRRN